MAYVVTITPSAYKELSRLPPTIEKRIRKALTKLSADPFATGIDVKKLKGRNHYRLRVGDYRVIYDVRTAELVILVLEAGHRQHIYH